jgi:hypothetical protein
MGPTLKTGLYSNVSDSEIRVLEKPSPSIQPQLMSISGRAPPDILKETALQLSTADLQVVR